MKKLLILALAAGLQQDATRPDEPQVLELIDSVASSPAPISDRPFVGSINDPSIEYVTRPARDIVAELNRNILDGKFQLKPEGERNGREYLRAVLEALDVPIESQIVVFSKTSVQSQRISPTNPRTIFFNDSVAVGWVRGGFVELAAQDPQQGIVFYVLDQQSTDRPGFARRDDCLGCHHSYNSLDVPGMLVRSVFPGPSGNGMYQFGSFLSDHRSPLEQRWGGWYVTGKHGSMRHLGNATVSDPDNPESMSTGQALNLDTLNGKFDASAYLSPYSDIVALMVFEHQMRMMNLLTRVGWEFRLASSLQRSAGKRNDNMDRILRESTKELVDYLLFVDEAPLTDKIQGASGFAEKFSARGPLRQFDLERRLMRYPCSYMIYSQAFDNLPADARDAIYARMWQVLSGEEKENKYARLSLSDRQAVVEILRQTKTGLPGYFTGETPLPR